MKRGATDDTVSREAEPLPKKARTLANLETMWARFEEEERRAITRWAAQADELLDIALGEVDTWGRIDDDVIAKTIELTPKDDVKIMCDRWRQFGLGTHVEKTPKGPDVTLLLRRPPPPLV